MGEGVLTSLATKNTAKLNLLVESVRRDPRVQDRLDYSHHNPRTNLLGRGTQRNVNVLEDDRSLIWAQHLQPSIEEVMPRAARRLDNGLVDS